MTQPQESDNGPRVDELRERLRSLGYLDAGVDRFVLAPARGARGAAAIALGASVRIGALGGMALGPAAALGVASQLPGLVTSFRDGIVAAIYMALFFGAGIAVAALACGLIVALAARTSGATLARRGRALSIAAGMAAALVSLAYLTLLWTAVRSAGTDSHAGLWAAAGLGVAVAISLLLGHAVTLTALALIVAGTGQPIRTRGVPGASWRVMLGAGAAAFGAALVLFNAQSAARPGDETGRAPTLTVVPSGMRVRLLAIDGFDPSLFASLVSRGKLPVLARAFDGAGAQLTLQDDGDEVSAPLDPARLWTTVATAQPASLHGVRTLETRRVAGLQGIVQGGSGSALLRLVSASTDLLRLTRPSVASGNERRESTFWEVAADAGLRTAVVNWWATWPAASDNGVVLSDRAMLRLERGGSLDGEMAPASIYQQLAPRWPALREQAAARAIRALAAATARGGEQALLRRSAEMDAMALLLASEVSGAATDLTAVYLPGLDIMQHARVEEPASPGLPGAAASVRLSALESYYVALDTLLADDIQPSSGELVVVVTAPGRGAGLSGRLVVSGATARRGAAITARATDVAPTLLYALGLPISQALAGAPLTALFAERFVARYPVRHVATYGRPRIRAAPARGQPLDQEMIDRLRSLGYLR